MLHARVLDYMRDIDLQDGAAVMVFMPDRRHRWMSLGYAGFIGTVTAMNEKGPGDRRDGRRRPGPLGRHAHEPAGAQSHGTGGDGRRGRRRSSAPRRGPASIITCSATSRGHMAALRCTADEVTVLRPGQQHPRLPLVPDDTVLVSGGDRARTLTPRMQQRTAASTWRR